MPFSIKDSIELPKSYLYKDERGFLWVKFKSNIDFDLPDAVEQEAAILAYCNGEKMPFLVDGRVEMSFISNEARNYLAKSEKLLEIRQAQALLVSNLAIRIIANFYIKVNKPLNPVRIFKEEEESIEWLLSFKNKKPSTKSIKGFLI